MGFEKGHPKYGGRKAGELTIAQRCKAVGADPVMVLLEALGEPENKMRAAEILMRYMHPQLKAVEWTLKDVPDQVFDQEVERRIHLKILKGEKVG